MRKVLYIGSDGFSAKILRELFEFDDLEIVAAATYPDKPKGRGHKLIPTPVKSAALELNLPLVEIPDVNDPEIHKRLASFGAPLAVLVSFKIVPKEFLAAFPEGVINLHPALLPDLRGAAPIQWAIMLGYKKSGLTTFIVSEKVDCGKILLQNEFDINIDETAGEVFEKIVHPGAEILSKSISGYLSGEIVPMEQSSDEYRHRAPRILHKHRNINWKWSSEKIHNRIRGLSPSPCAISMFGEKIIKILRSKSTGDRISKNPGEIANIEDDRIIVNTGDGTIALLELQPEGRPKMTAAEFARGYVKPNRMKFS